MKIATVTLNPAIDQTVRVDSFHLNTVNYAQAMQSMPGGSGQCRLKPWQMLIMMLSRPAFFGKIKRHVRAVFRKQAYLDDRLSALPGVRASGSNC